MKVSEIKKEIFFEGRHAGVPCVYVNFLDKKAPDMDLDWVITEVLKFDKVKNVAVFGKLSEEPEIKTLITGLAAKGKRIIFSTPATEDIGPVRPVPNISFVLGMKPPTKQVNNIRISNMALLKEGDELKIAISNLQDYEDAKIFVRSRSFTLPTILFSLNKVENTDEIMNAYLDDCDSFIFNNKLSQAIFL